MSNPHPHAELIKQLAEDQNLTLWVWLNGTHEWTTTSPAELFFQPLRVYAVGDRPAPLRKMCQIGRFAFPMPETKPLTTDAEYWKVAVTGKPQFYRWRGDKWDEKWLAGGLVQLTESGAIAQSLAIEAAIKDAVEKAQQG